MIINIQGSCLGLATLRAALGGSWGIDFHNCIAQQASPTNLLLVTMYQYRYVYDMQENAAAPIYYPETLGEVHILHPKEIHQFESLLYKISPPWLHLSSRGPMKDGNVDIHNIYFHHTSLQIL